MPLSIAIFASGSGSNAEQIIQHFKDHPLAEVSLILSNKPDAYVLTRAQQHGIPNFCLSQQQFRDPDHLLTILAKYDVDLIALAGYLQLIPEFLIQSFPKRILNIHPALLPKYGGKGMYGPRVHQAVFDNYEKESGITIHYVDAAYDEGQIIFQEKVILASADTPDVIAKKVLELEHKNYAPIIEQVLSKGD